MLPRFLIPWVYISDGVGIMRVKDMELHHVRTTHDDQKWDYNMSSAEFRARLPRMEREVRAGRAALRPDARFLMQHWATLEAHRNEGPFRTRWMYMNSFGPRWDVTAVDEHVGNVVYENRPFQMLYPGCCPCSPRQTRCPNARGVALRATHTSGTKTRPLCVSGARIRTSRGTRFRARIGHGR